MEKNNWITNILNSTNGIKSIEPSDDLFSKIQQIIQILIVAALCLGLVPLAIGLVLWWVKG